jgi:hypothetical protein
MRSWLCSSLSYCRLDEESMPSRTSCQRPSQPQTHAFSPCVDRQLEFFAQQEMVTIVPNFSLQGGFSLFCIGVRPGQLLFL